MDISKKQIFTLLNETNPEFKFQLLSRVRKEVDDDAEINKLFNENKLLIARRICGGRGDGLTERLRSILVSYIYYKYLKSLKYNVSYEFIWPLNAERQEFTSITSETPSFIKEDFVSEYFVSNFSVNRLDDKNLPEKGLHEPDSIVDFYNDAIVNYSTISTPRVIKSPDLLGLIPEALDDIFSDDVHVKFEKIKQQLPRKLIGLHLRGGDVVYGRFKDAIRLGKSLPLPLAEQYISAHPGSKIVLFGTNIGDSLNDLIYLRDKYNKVVDPKNWTVI